MKFQCTVLQRADGVWRAQHVSEEVGEIAVSALSREAALEKLCGEIRYRLELCPCSGESYRHIDVEAIDQPNSRAG